MNQWQYDTIKKIVESGSPALCNELNSSLTELVNLCNSLTQENNLLKEKVEAIEKARKSHKKLDNI